MPSRMWTEMTISWPLARIKKVSFKTLRARLKAEGNPCHLNRKRQEDRGVKSRAARATYHFSNKQQKKLKLRSQGFQGSRELRVESIGMITGRVALHNFHTRFCRSWQFRAWADRTSDSKHSWPLVSWVVKCTRLWLSELTHEDIYPPPRTTEGFHWDSVYDSLCLAWCLEYGKCLTSENVCYCHCHCSCHSSILTQPRATNKESIK